MWQVTTRTDVGRVRTGNEDAVVVDDAVGFFAVADGMGGHNAGEVAARLALDTVLHFIRASRVDSGITWPYGFVPALSFEANQLKSAIQLANQEIRFQAQRRPGCDGMGATIVALLARGPRVWYASVGDSRLYLWRDGALTQLSQDDSWAASMLKAGADPATVGRHEMRHMLTRALGTAQTLDVDVSLLDTRPGDVLLACSDGLYGPVGDEGLVRLLTAAGDDLDAAAGALLTAALEAGGPDNISLVLARRDNSGREAPAGGESGQALTEYVVTAGLLVAIGIVVSGLLIGIMKDFVVRMLHELSFLTP